MYRGFKEGLYNGRILSPLEILSVTVGNVMCLLNIVRPQILLWEVIF